MSRRSPDTVELLLLFAFAVILSLQLFIPPVIGLADNGDFGKVYSQFSLTPNGGGADNFAYFNPRYWFLRGLSWKSDVPSSEIAVAAGPILLTRALRRPFFDLRWLGALHALLFLGAFYALLIHLRRGAPWRKALVGIAVLWIFGDVAYVAYCNSLYSDTAAIIGALLLTPLALEAVSRNKVGEGMAWLIVLSSMLFIASKPQHAAVGLIPVAIVLWLVRLRFPAVLLMLALVFTMWRAPSTYKAKPLFNLIFYKIAPKSATPLQDLRELGLGESDMRFVGMHAYTPGGPGSDDQWMADFSRRTGFSKVCLFYLRHPLRALAILDSDLRYEAFQIRPQGLGNFRRERGVPPGSLTGRFTSWSNLRSRLFIRWQWHIVIWFAVFIAISGRMARHSRPAALALGIACMALGEFAVSSLADSVETFRHLLLFHLLTDITICLAVGWILSLIPSRASRRDTVAAHSDSLLVHS